MLDGNGRIHASDAEAVRALTRRGVRVSFATGRMYSGSRDLARELELGGPLGCVDGSHVVDVTTEQELYCHSIDHQKLSALLAVLEIQSQASFVFADDGIFHDRRGERFVPYISVWSRRTECADDVFARDYGRDRSSVTAVVAVGDERAMLDAASRLEASAQALTVTTFPIGRREFQGMRGLIVRAAGADKASALRHIAEYHGVAVEETIAVGDWLNDVSMLRAAGRSFAMAHAPSEVKACATDQLRASAETGGGIREAAERSDLL